MVEKGNMGKIASLTSFTREVRANASRLNSLTSYSKQMFKQFQYTIHNAEKRDQNYIDFKTELRQCVCILQAESFMAKENSYV